MAKGRSLGLGFPLSSSLSAIKTTTAHGPERLPIFSISMSKRLRLRNAGRFCNDRCKFYYSFCTQFVHSIFDIWLCSGSIPKHIVEAEMTKTIPSNSETYRAC
ncbi:hypothetical protein U1Q18_023219 [Sarracenia purpurea var. burkii]